MSTTELKILVIAEQETGDIKAATRSAITAAQAFNGTVSVLLAGHDAAETANAAAIASRIVGVAQVLTAVAPAYEHGLAENLTPLLLTQAAEFDVVLLAATSFGKNLLPRLAALLDVTMVSEVTQIVDATTSTFTFVRPIYAGNLNATVQINEAKTLLTVRPASFSPAENGAETAAPINALIVAGMDSGLSAWLSEEISQSERPELGTARVIVSGGRALGSEAQFHAVLTPLADKLGAAIGATRAAVDAGYAPNEWQVGQTGTVVAPELYIALGVSGAVQHQAGVRDSRVIVAINTDPDAAIFQWADYGLVADLFETAQALQTVL